MKHYNKLVRDRIPEMIQAGGKNCAYELVPDEQYIEKLNEKLLEEVNDYLKSGETEELVDVLEVIYTIASTHGISGKQLEESRKKKANERGGFARRIFLKAVY